MADSTGCTWREGRSTRSVRQAAATPPAAPRTTRCLRSIITPHTPHPLENHTGTETAPPAHRCLLCADIRHFPPHTTHHTTTPYAPHIPRTAGTPCRMLATHCCTVSSASAHTSRQLTRPSSLHRANSNRLFSPPHPQSFRLLQYRSNPSSAWGTPSISIIVPISHGSLCIGKGTEARFTRPRTTHQHYKTPPLSVITCLAAGIPSCCPHAASIDRVTSSSLHTK